MASYAANASWRRNENDVDAGLGGAEFWVIWERGDAITHHWRRWQGEFLEDETMPQVRSSFS